MTSISISCRYINSCECRDDRYQSTPGKVVYISNCSHLSPQRLFIANAQYLKRGNGHFSHHVDVGCSLVLEHMQLKLWCRGRSQSLHVLTKRDGNGYFLADSRIVATSPRILSGCCGESSGMAFENDIPRLKCNALICNYDCNSRGKQKT